MQVTVTVSDEIVRAAGFCGTPIIDYVESLITKGQSADSGCTDLSSAIERIRALRSSEPVAKG